MKVPFLNLQAAYVELKPEIDTAVQRVLESGWYIFGEEIQILERNEAITFVVIKISVNIVN